MGRLNEKKSLVYFASGLRLNGATNQAQLQATINAAVRAGVSSGLSMREALLLKRRSATRVAGRPAGSRCTRAPRPMQ